MTSATRFLSSSWQLALATSSLWIIAASAFWVSWPHVAPAAWASLLVLGGVGQGLFLVAVGATTRLGDQRRTSEELRFSALADSAQDAIISGDEAGNMVAWNVAATRLFGFERVEALGKPLSLIMPDRFHAAHRDGMQRFLKTGQAKVIGRTVEVAGRRKDGSEFPCELSLSVWDRDGKQYFTGFLRDITERVQARDALLQSEFRFRTLVKSAPVAIFETDEHGHCIFINQAWSQLTGLGVEEALGDGWAKALHPEDKARVFAEWARSAEEHRGFASEYRYVGTQSTVWVVGYAVPLFDAGGAIIGHLGTIIDITERKRAGDAVAASLAEKEVLLREVHHRVKNNLQVISSLLRLQAAKIHDVEARDVFLDCQSRVQSIALIHDSLYQASDLARVDMGQYVHKLVGGIRRTYAGAAAHIEVTIRVADVALPVDRAVPCGLIINELLTNAFKHAFPASYDQGKGNSLNITMSGDETIRLVVQDDGVGLPADFSAASEDHLGTILISTLSNQLDAQVTFDGSRGTRCELVFDAVALEAAS